MIRKIVVPIAQKLGIYQIAVKIETYFRNKRLSKAFKKEGLNTLKVANDELKRAGYTFFPTCGTLLGFYREHNFIKYDCDLDGGVLIHNCSSEDVVKVLANAGFTHTLQLFIKDINVIVEDRFVRKGVQLDIFYHFEEDEKYYCYFTQRHETKDWRQANREDGFPTLRCYMDKCDFEEREFLGKTIVVPTKIENWLENTYGEDFMIPIKNWTYGKRKICRVNLNERVYRRIPTDSAPLVRCLSCV